jgi:PTS system cellobiose-specific IIC component
MEAFWTFFIVIGGSGATMGLVFCYLRSRSAHLRSIGRLSVVPSLFNINEPVIFGTPIVMNPVFFIPFLLAPMVNATGLGGDEAGSDWPRDFRRSVDGSCTDWRGVGAGLGFPAAVLSLSLRISAIIYFPFFKVYEKQLLEQEAEEAQRGRRSKWQQQRRSIVSRAA